MVDRGTGRNTVAGIVLLRVATTEKFRRTCSEIQSDVVVGGIVLRPKPAPDISGIYSDRRNQAHHPTNQDSWATVFDPIAQVLFVRNYMMRRVGVK